MKAVIYARYSSDSQRDESIDGQIRECKEYAERNGLKVLSCYIDRALSAKTDNRPEFQRMIRDSAGGLFDVVLVWKLDRFARNRYDSAHYKAILKKNGVKVVSAKEAIAEDSTGILLESLLEGYAEFYSVELSEKIHRGQKENALKGKNNGGGIPLGYVLNHQTQKLEIDPLTAPLVVEIFTRYADGETVRSIVDDLNGRGLRTRRGKPFRLNSFSALLKNRKYIGEYQYQDVIIPGGVPAIVPQELFDRVQRRMEKNKRAPAAAKAEERYLLTTKLFCGKCGRMMIGECGTSRAGVKHYYYKCGSAKRKTGCDKKAVRKQWIEDLVVEHTMRMILNDTVVSDVAALVVQAQDRENTDLPALQNQLAQTERGIENLLNAIQQGIFTASTKQRLDELEEAKEELTVRILQEQIAKPRMTEEEVRFWICRFRELDTTKEEHRQRLIDSFVNAVYVYDDKILLIFNYKDGQETVPLKEANDSDLSGGCPPKLEIAAVKTTAISHLTTEIPQTDFCFDHLKGTPWGSALLFLFTAAQILRVGCLSSIKHHDPLPYVGSTWNGIPEPYLQIKIKFL
ncbi:recombinase family protein [Pseudoflavonifractor phocaeensis]|uniref:recombinase family protein n=1 Tax=Pseudoflavonifractor phocaeensis TaxID=1870988 RepID=UPI00195DC54A|nr:recombinase family protein [Pseudoflavonifractor phocaeensis]